MGKRRVAVWTSSGITALRSALSLAVGMEILCELGDSGWIVAKVIHIDERTRMFARAMSAGTSFALSFHQKILATDDDDAWLVVEAIKLDSPKMARG